MTDTVTIKSERNVALKLEQVAPPQTVMHTVLPSPQAHQQSSLEILLQWLTTEGKFKRWRNGQKVLLAEEILGLFHLEGISGYTSTDVHEMISKLEKSAQNANESLVQNGKWGLLSLDACNDERLKSQILLCCPYIDSLAPIIMGDKRLPVSRMKCEPTSQAGSQSAPVILIDDPSQSDDEDVVEIVVVKEEFSSRPCRVKRKRSSFTFNTIPDPESIEQQFLKRSEVLDIELRRARFQVDQEKRRIELDATREKSKIDIAVSRALARQKLFNAGLSKAEVDRIVPELSYSE